MTRGKPLARSVGNVIAAALTLLVAGTVIAQTVPQGDAMEIFQKLTPEQQQAILERAGILTGQDGTPGTGTVPERTVQSADQEARQREQNKRPRAQEEREPSIPVLLPEDTVSVELSLPQRQEQEQEPVSPGKPLDPSKRSGLEDLIALVQSRNPYVLDRNGQLNLPGFAPIALGGLTERQATQRLSVEPVLLPLTVRLMRLPLAKTGVAGLKPFGYDLFDEESAFSPVTDGPVPVDYVMGTGDELTVQLFGGNQNRTLRLTVNRDGSVTFPELGPIRVSGLTFNAARQLIESRVTQQMIGVRANVSVSEVRSIRVIVTGEARRPGSYMVSGLATMITALFVSGGVNPIGSLRDIQLKRQGVVVRRLDLYDLRIRGDNSGDAKLLPGDVIFIPTIGDTVAVDGEVKRPAIYELRGETSIADMVQIAGGLTPAADTNRGSLTRIDEASRRVVLNVSLNQPADRSQSARNGDVLRIAALRPQVDAGVMLDGFVHRPGVVAWREGLRLSDVIGSVDELKPGADPRYILIRRESGPDRRISPHSADLVAALAAPGSAADVVMAPRDQITVFDLAPGRERIIKPLLDELRLQSDLSRPTEVVRVGGRVRVPGEYPLEPGMRVSDLLRAGGNLQAAAYGAKAELARYVVGESGSRQTDLIPIDLAAVRRGDAAADLPLRPYDYLVIQETPDWTEQESVTLKGQVQRPGTYAIRKGETLRQVIDRAGGLTSLAFVKGSAFTRRETRENEQRQMDVLGQRLQSDLASLSLQAVTANQPGAAQALTSAQSMLEQLRVSKAVGRLVIDLPGLLAASPGSVKDIELRDGDELVIPKQRQEVTVIGEVQNTTSHVYSTAFTRDDYINLSGGATRKADRRQIYVVRADGSVIARGGTRLSRNYNLAIQPGDTIVVPLDTERMPRLPFWQAVTQIIYNLAVSVAAVNSF
jgi:polysaccharide biosynthesis/export protein